MTPERKITFTSAHGFFDDLVVYLVALQGFLHSTEIYNGGYARPWNADETGLMDAKQVGKRLEWVPAPLVATVCRNDWPEFLDLTETDADPIAPGAQLNLGAIGPLMFSFGQSTITNYYERYKDEIVQTWGAYEHWPPIWSFGRVVRNAMSHGGKIVFKNQKASAVRWRDLIYSPEDNGRLVLHGDLWPGDIFYLLAEMEEVLVGARKDMNKLESFRSGD